MADNYQEGGNYVETTKVITQTVQPVVQESQIKLRTKTNGPITTSQTTKTTVTKTQYTRTGAGKEIETRSVLRTNRNEQQKQLPKSFSTEHYDNIAFYESNELHKNPTCYRGRYHNDLSGKMAPPVNDYYTSTDVNESSNYTQKVTRTKNAQPSGTTATYSSTVTYGTQSARPGQTTTTTKTQYSRTNNTNTQPLSNRGGQTSSQYSYASSNTKTTPSGKVITTKQKMTTSSRGVAGNAGDSGAVYRTQKITTSSTGANPSSTVRTKKVVTTTTKTTTSTKGKY